MPTSRAIGCLSKALARLVGINDHLGRVLPEATHPEHGKQGVAVGDPHEQPLRPTRQRLVAKVLDQRRRDLVRIRAFGDLQVQHLQDLRPRQVEAALLPRGLHVADHLAAIVRDVDERLL